MSELYPTITDVDCKFGAPHGRSAWLGEPQGAVRLFKVPLDNGGYDIGGAYWGTPDDLFCATDGQEFRVFRRAGSLEEAKRLILGEYPGLALVTGSVLPDAPNAEALKEMVRGYIETVIWDHPEGENDMSELGPEDFAPETVAEIEAECQKFLEVSWETLKKLDHTPSFHTLGFDFYMSQVGAGVGLWDRPEAYGKFGDVLDALVDEHGLKWAEFYVGNDGKVYG